MMMIQSPQLAVQPVAITLAHFPGIGWWIQSFDRYGEVIDDDFVGTDAIQACKYAYRRCRVAGLKSYAMKRFDVVEIV